MSSRSSIFLFLVTFTRIATSPFRAKFSEFRIQICTDFFPFVFPSASRVEQFFWKRRIKYETISLHGKLPSRFNKWQGSHKSRSWPYVIPIWIFRVFAWSMDRWKLEESLHHGSEPCKNLAGKGEEVIMLFRECKSNLIRKFSPGFESWQNVTFSRNMVILEKNAKKLGERFEEKVEGNTYPSNLIIIILIKNWSFFFFYSLFLFIRSQWMSTISNDNNVDIRNNCSFSPFLFDNYFEQLVKYPRTIKLPLRNAIWK